ncbi:platelet-activating factor acetylhydrolase, isoform II-domain-containing protein [Syncephalis fuscata]|nr:platelet-activating factor acetylhydrolase, isoform II-domain-containing protein [Syncephalis fuscata]
MGDQNTSHPASPVSATASPEISAIDTCAQTSDNDVITQTEETVYEEKVEDENKTYTRSWRSRLTSHFSVFSKLPKYTGPYEVGCHDIEWHGGSGRSYRGTSMTSVETATNSNDANVELVAEQEPVLVRLYYPARLDGEKQKAAWLPPPAFIYGQGYGDFARLPRLLSTPLAATMRCIGGHHLPESTSTQPDAGQFPVVMFSHGLGGCRTTYSGICGELASHGFVVCAIEHRDGTASVTSLDNGEIHCAWELLERLNAGNAIDNCLEQNTSNKTDNTTPKRFSQAQLKGRLDLSRAVMAGHSFGAATTIEALREPGTPYCCAINSQAFTIWNENFKPLREQMILWNGKQQEQTTDNARTIRSGQYGPSWLFTVRESGHQNQSDFPIIFDFLTRRVPNFGGKCDPVEALVLNNQVCLEFIRQNLPLGNKKDDPLRIFANNKLFTDNASLRPYSLLLHRLDGTYSEEEEEMLFAEQQSTDAADASTVDPEPAMSPQLSTAASS